MITIYDIAKKTGYSPTTVSKVFNNYTDVKEQTRQTILQAAKELGYLPNAHARTLTTKKSWTIGVLFVESSGIGMQHPFFSAVIESFKQVAVSKGYALMFISKDVGGKQSGYLENCKIRGVDGVVVILSDYEDPYFKELLDSDIPCVVLDYETSQAHTLYSDNLEGSLLAVEYLYSLGHRKIAHISGGINTFAGSKRVQGYELAMTRLNLETKESYIVDSAYYSIESGYAAMVQILDLQDRPTAVFVAGDHLALGAMRAARERGLRIPNDLSIVGFDNIELSQYITPALTTIAQDTALMGSKAADILIHSIDNPSQVLESAVLPVRLIVRDSCSSVTNAP
ncbi:LacI family DNA-binding transcriptional regulator [Paenibacillus macquariensis]|uniref:Transcriptional regulator, LacI family n=1 Tax=Paenibacillus macquariensis TaxID=948756 RepID=A0ABY1KAQ3_9BACL|nr:LacI family DNA-binding transcriptional regulator [Paenibacillus macquariensis]MEC0089459.1 LacI family DNA-binding transcriptional regulator [Paenibacillus macquariensis]OAB25859.1 LacI family transcriptional regulator [Paenibacillus macquariensis subsp. macquariensis]SIR52326.1 transcriptional regulator, LacI family [Paenibacillus macquariensis]